MSHDKPLSTSLLGTWVLDTRIDLTATGERYPDPLLGEDPVALLIYHQSGYFSAQFMKRDRSAAVEELVPGAKNNTRAQGGYDAYFGSYSVNNASGEVTQALMGCLSADNVGMVLTRAMQVEGDTLTIALDTNAADGTPVTRTLSWTRAR